MRSRSIVRLTTVVLVFGCLTVFGGLACYDACGPAEANASILSEPWAMAERAPMSADAITEWNQYAATLTLRPSPMQQPVEQTRTMAIIQVSMHDAVNGITRKYETYRQPGAAPPDASAEAAAIGAAYRAMLGMFGNGPFPVLGNRTLDQVFSDSLATNGISPANPGIGYGILAANAILAERANDGAALASFPYDGPSTDAGIWRLLPGQTALLPGWGNVTPFVMRSASQFRPDPPPALDSEIYARDYNEIKDIGKSVSPNRTPLQTQIATFWRSSPTAIWNPVITQAVVARGLDISDAARAYAMFYLASADASIAVWESKYYYNSWRPQPAIRRGDEDGNTATDADPTWAPLFPTPPHPEYPSAHTSNSSSMAHILEYLFGRDPGMTISVTLSGINRQWTTFDQAAEEVIDARVFSGIHFRNSDEVGARQGRQIGQFVLTHELRPCGKGGGRCS